MKKIAFLLLSGALSLTACGPVFSSNSGLSSEESSEKGSSSDLPVEPLSEEKIYNRLLSIRKAMRFRMKGRTVDSIYHPNYIEYLSSKTGLAKVAGFEASYAKILMGFHYDESSLGKKSYGLDMVSQASSEDYKTPATDLNNYIYLSLLGAENYPTSAEDIFQYDDGGYGIRYDSSWNENTTNWLFYILAGQLGYYSYASKGYVTELRFSFDAGDDLLISIQGSYPGGAYLETFSFSEVGSASDPDLEAFLGSEQGKIPSSAISDSLFASLTATSLSTDTTFSMHDADGLLSSATMHQDIGPDGKHVYVDNAPDSSFYYRKGKNGNAERVFVDGTNHWNYEDTEKTYESIGIPIAELEQSEIRAGKPDSEEFHYYGVNENAIVGALAGLDFMSVYNVGVRSMSFLASGGRVTGLKATTYSFPISGTDGATQYVYIEYEVSILETPREVGKPALYDADKDTPTISSILENMNSYDTISYDAKEWFAGSESDPYPAYETVGVYSPSLQYTKQARWNEDFETEKWEEEVSVKGWIDKGEEGPMPFAMYPNGLSEASGPARKGVSLKDVAPFPLKVAPEVLTLSSAWNALVAKDDTIEGELYAVLPLGTFGSLLPSKDVIITLDAKKERIASITYRTDFKQFGYQIEMSGEVTFSYGEDVQIDETIQKIAESLPLFVTPTSWSTSYNGKSLVSTFASYFAGCVDGKGNALSIDVMPYKYFEGDDDWVGSEWANGEYHLVASGADLATYQSMRSDLEALFQKDASFVAKTETGTNALYYVNGDLAVRLSERISEGLVLTKASTHTFLS